MGAVGPLGHTGDPPIPALLEDMHSIPSPSIWLSPEVNYKHLRQPWHLGSLQSHKQAGDVTQGCSPFFFQCKEPGPSHSKSREQRESKERCCLIWCMDNPGHSSLQGADAKILPEFRETREISGLKNHEALLSAMAVLLRDAGAAGSRMERVCGGCVLPGHLPQPCTSPLGGWLLLSIAARYSSEAANLDTSLPGENPPRPAPSPRAL